MNQRIKELAEQAGYKHPDAVGMSEDYAYFSYEKFAELIVRECADWAFSNEWDRNDMLKHFGIE